MKLEKWQKCRCVDLVNYPLLCKYTHLWLDKNYCDKCDGFEKRTVANIDEEIKEIERQKRSFEEEAQKRNERISILKEYKENWESEEEE